MQIAAIQPMPAATDTLLFLTWSEDRKYKVQSWCGCCWRLVSTQPAPPPLCAVLGREPLTPRLQEGHCTGLKPWWEVGGQRPQHPVPGSLLLRKGLLSQTLHCTFHCSKYGSCPPPTQNMLKDGAAWHSLPSTSGREAGQPGRPLTRLWRLLATPHPWYPLALT